VAVAGLSLAIPASATTGATASDCAGPVCSYTLKINGTYWQYEAQVNNNQTGTGVTSWIWVYTNAGAAHADYYLNGDSTMHTLTSPVDGSTSKNLPKDVTAFRVCGDNGIGGDACSPWAHPTY
jgi:hypothetical protein